MNFLLYEKKGKKYEFYAERKTKKILRFAFNEKIHCRRTLVGRVNDCSQFRGHRKPLLQLAD
jgi:hypothetical protein